jgi:hypothetical protein
VCSSPSSLLPCGTTACHLLLIVSQEEIAKARNTFSWLPFLYDAPGRMATTDVIDTGESTGQGLALTIFDVIANLRRMGT